ncbi:DUF3862 domain-containing protein [Paenibacillus tyrfis]|uniref:DUF3862 domain-containing protein n=1 Tax=Paenibacillus tyrfis TaxID=1501230 RepID=UPI0020A0264C|nr:DUF3862 domain-containing protein [Paenibacillus tyrfis]MCP1307213.1 DUF3862 domain-containing protein [Paenibacillus tyrfis]
MKHLLTFTAALMIVVISGCGAAPAKEANTPAKETSSTTKEASTPAKEAGAPAGEKKTESKQATITKEEFDKIENGQTYEEVSKIIGGPGELVAEAGTKGEKSHTVGYMYKGEGSPGANANFAFQDGKLVTKAQFGLK